MKYPLPLIAVIALGITGASLQADPSTDQPVKNRGKPVTVPLPARYSLTPDPVLLGKLAFGTKKEFVVTVHNRGKAPLTIKKVRSSCVCLEVVDFTRDSISPNGSGRITGRMTPSDKEGDTRKLFYVHLSDKAAPIAKVVVQATFIKPEGGKLVLSSTVLEFGQVKRLDKPRLAVLRLMNFGDQALKVTEILNSNPALTIKLDSNKTFAPHQGVSLRAWLNCSQLEVGPFSEEVILMTDSPRTPAVTLKATARVFDSSAP